MLNSKHIRRRFERAAEGFDQVDFVHAATREGLLARIAPLLVDATTVVDLGAATGGATRALEKRFKGARVLSIDIAHNMLKVARTRKSWRSKTAVAQADAAALPLATGSVDVIFSNLLLPWVSDLDRVFTEIARVLRKEGVFAFATLGPDSLQEIRRAWRRVDNGAHVTPFPDMHNLGDGLVQAGLRDPVLDVDRLSVSYTDSRRLLADLTAAGARNALLERRKTLTGRGRFATMQAMLDEAAGSGSMVLDLELVFGHCWGAGPKKDFANYTIDAQRIPVRRK